MAKIFEQEHIVPAWHAAAKHLLTSPKQTDFNLILEIHDPLSIAQEDRPTMTAVDQALRAASSNALTLNTVAATIFPQAMYTSYGRPAMYQKFLTALDRGRKPRSWGTYAERMMCRPAKDGMSTINPLEIIIQKLHDNVAPNRNAYRSTFELGIADPEADLLPWPHMEDIGADLPTYNPAFDANRLYGLPCLSHISFKLIDREKVNMVAIYRSHHYCARALGNLLGLAQLLKFVSTEAGLQAGTLTCISTHAELDVSSWGGINIARQILD